MNAVKWRCYSIVDELIGKKVELESRNQNKLSLKGDIYFLMFRTLKHIAGKAPSNRFLVIVFTISNKIVILLSVFVFN